jgi:negative regulator of replication initiation
MKNLHENMNDILGIEGDLITEDDNKRPMVIPKSKDQDKDIQNDYEYARANLYGIIEQGSDALNSLLELAKASEHPRAFEVVATLSKTLMDANKDLIDIQKKVKDLKKKDEVQEGGDVTNNNLFVGSTADLLKMIKNDGSD